MKVVVLEAVIAVRRRFMKAVFFLSEESRDGLTGKTSVPGQCMSHVSAGLLGEWNTFFASPCSGVQVTQFTLGVGVS